MTLDKDTRYGMVWYLVESKTASFVDLQAMSDEEIDQLFRETTSKVLRASSYHQ